MEPNEEFHTCSEVDLQKMVDGLDLEELMVMNHPFNTCYVAVGLESAQDHSVFWCTGAHHLLLGMRQSYTVILKLYMCWSLS